LGLLQQDKFEEQLSKVFEVFDRAQDIWTNNKSRFGIKDNREFTNLLLKLCREQFIQNQTSSNDKEDEATHNGTILRVVWRSGVWYGFIRRGYQYENIYFDSRGYNGEARDLIPGTKVKFKMGRNRERSFATNVELVS